MEVGLHEILMQTISRDTCADNLLRRFSRKYKQPLLNSKRFSRKCQKVVLLMVDDGSVFLNHKTRKITFLGVRQKQEKKWLRQTRNFQMHC